MGQTIASVIGLCLAVYGAAELIGRVACKLVFGKGTLPTVIWVRAEEAEYRLRQLAAWRRYVCRDTVQPTVLLQNEDDMVRRLGEELGISVLKRKEWDGMCKNGFTTAEK